MFMITATKKPVKKKASDTEVGGKKAPASKSKVKTPIKDSPASSPTKTPGARLKSSSLAQTENSSIAGKKKNDPRNEKESSKSLLTTDDIEDSKFHDGSGVFIWPRMQMPNGQWYGFDRQILATKRAESLGDDALFGGQYFNNPEVGGENRINRDNFIYLQPNLLENRQGRWYYGSKELKLSCGMDLAFSEKSTDKNSKRDFTSIAVTAWDAEGYLYILQLKRFQTAKAEVYYKELFDLHQYWDFREATVETNAGGAVVANFIQDEIRREGHTLVIKHQHKNQREGIKEERNAQLFQPLYRTKSVYHTKGGYTRLLEEELVSAKPAHDDLMDSIWIAISNSKRPSRPKFSTNRKTGNVLDSQSRFLNRRRRA